MSPQLRALQHYEPLDADLPKLAPVPDDVPEPRAAPAEVTEVNARRLLMFVVEATDGRRPQAQLAGLLSSGAMDEVSRVLRPGRHTRLGRLHTCRVSESAVEVAATITQNTRVRALAARLELDGETWKCTLFRVLP
jgi:hypothetical protein